MVPGIILGIERASTHRLTARWGVILACVQLLVNALLTVSSASDPDRPRSVIAADAPYDDSTPWPQEFFTL